MPVPETSEPTWSPVGSNVLKSTVIPPGLSEYCLLIVVITDKGVSTQVLTLVEAQAVAVAANIDAHNLDTTNQVAVKYGLLYAI